MRVPHMQPGRRAREEGLVAGQLPDYETDDCGEPSDASAEEVRTYVSHRFVVAACQFAALRVALYRLQGAVRLLQGPSSRASAAAMAEAALIDQHCQESMRYGSKLAKGPCPGSAALALLSR